MCGLKYRKLLSPDLTDEFFKIKISKDQSTLL